MAMQKSVLFLLITLSEMRWSAASTPEASKMNLHKEFDFPSILYTKLERPISATSFHSPLLGPLIEVKKAMGSLPARLPPIYHPHHFLSHGPYEGDADILFQNPLQALGMMVHAPNQHPNLTSDQHHHKPQDQQASPTFGLLAKLQQQMTAQQALKQTGSAPGPTAGAAQGASGGAGAMQRPTGAAGAMTGPVGAAGAMTRPVGTGGAMQMLPGAAGAMTRPVGVGGAMQMLPGAGVGAMQGPLGTVGAMQRPMGSAGAMRNPMGGAGATQRPGGAAGATQKPGGGGGGKAKRPGGASTPKTPGGAPKAPGPTPFKPPDFDYTEENLWLTGGIFLTAAILKALGADIQAQSAFVQIPPGGRRRRKGREEEKFVGESGRIFLENWLSGFTARTKRRGDLGEKREEDQCLEFISCRQPFWAHFYLINLKQMKGGELIEKILKRLENSVSVGKSKCKTSFTCKNPEIQEHFLK